VKHSPLLKILGLHQNKRKDGEAINSAIKHYVDGHINESVERSNFRKRVQQRGESFDDFLVALVKLVTCSPSCVAKSTGSNH